MQGHKACVANVHFTVMQLLKGQSHSTVARCRDMVQHPCMCGPRLNIASLCDNLFLYFLGHPYILITFVENLYCSLASALFMEHKLRNTVYRGLTFMHTFQLATSVSSEL